MDIKYKLITSKNKAFNKKAIEYYENLKNKMIKANEALDFKFVPKEQSTDQAEQPRILREADETLNNREMKDVTKRIDIYLKESRDTLKELNKHPEFIQEIHLTSERCWKVFDEFFNEETGKTEYGLNDGSNYIQDKENLNGYTSEDGRYRFNGKPEDFKVDVKLPYTKEEGINVKDSIKKAQDQALDKLKTFRKQRQTIHSTEKELSRNLKLLEGMPEEFQPTYKVYAGGGYGSQSEDGMFGNEKYFIHMEKGTFVKLSQVGKLRRVFEAKKPRTRDHHVGVEIEFISKYNKYELAQLLFQNDVHEFVQLVKDESLRAEGEFKFTHELTVLAPEQMIHVVLARVLKAINDNEGSRVAKRCGLHVHLDMRNRDRKRCFYNLTKAQTIMYAMNPRSRVDGTQSDGEKDIVYSKRIDMDDIDTAVATLNAAGNREARYYGINPLALDRHQTLEIRIHSGSTNLDKISNWVKILTAIVNKEDKVNSEFTQVEDFCKYYNLDEAMTSYIKERIAKFKDKNGKHYTVDEAA